MMKDLKVLKSGRNSFRGKGFLPALVLSLAVGAAGGSLFAQNAAVVSMSPRGQAHLNWVKPGESQTVDMDANDQTFMAVGEQTMTPLPENTPAPAPTMKLTVQKPVAKKAVKKTAKKSAPVQTAIPVPSAVSAPVAEAVQPEAIPVPVVYAIPVTEVKPMATEPATTVPLPLSALLAQSASGAKPASSIKQVALVRKAKAEQKVSPAPVAVALADAADVASGIDAAVVNEPNAERANSEKRLYESYKDECSDPHTLSSIRDISYKISIEPGETPQSCPLPDEIYNRTPPTPIVFTWKASALCHKPLYFEDVQLERYGHTLCPLLQPALSGVRFWLTIPMLPYFMGTYPPNECVYDLGYYRPGSCAPSMIQPLPISARGGLIEAGAVVGAAALMP